MKSVDESTVSLDPGRDWGLGDIETDTDTRVRTDCEVFVSVEYITMVTSSSPRKRVRGRLGSRYQGGVYGFEV